ncbi:MAG TPA: hypothetical protein VK869_09895 [Rubrobacteraceae bacterium]|nr:hypothetical protein [Rubrobacteraceae bacterium]
MLGAKAGERRERRSPLRLLAGIVGWAALLCVPGGVLWALSPLGVHLSEARFNTPNVFWKLFPFAPLLLLTGLIGLHVRFSGRSGWLERVAFAVTLLGLVLVLAGNVGQFWLGVDDLYIMTAPAYYSFRLGLLVLAAGTMLFGVAAARDETLPVWGALPFAVGGLCGLVAFARDLGSFGAGLWVLFGTGWAWLGVVLLVEWLRDLWRGRRATT